MRTVWLAALASLLAATEPGTAASATQEVTRYRYDLPLALADAGAWPPERLQGVTLVLDEVTVDRGVMTWWVFINSGEEWDAATWADPCCVLNVAPRAIYLHDGQGQRYDGSFATGMHHVLSPGQRSLIIVNFPALSAPSGPFTLRLEAGVGLAAPPDSDEGDESPTASASAADERTLERRRAVEEARAPVEHAAWAIADVQLP